MFHSTARMFLQCNKARSLKYIIRNLCNSSSSNIDNLNSSNINTMEIIRVYAERDGHTHFSSFHIKLQPSGPIGALSKMLPTEGIIFRYTPSSYDYNWHQTPQRQFVVNLDAGLEIEVSSGDRKIIQPGGVFLLEDVTGKGHKSRALDGKPRRSLFIPVPESFNIIDYV